MQAHTQQCHKRTCCLFRAAQHDTRNIRRKSTSTQSRHHHFNVFGQQVRVRLRLHTASETPLWCIRGWLRFRLHTVSNTNNTAHTAINATNVPSVRPGSIRHPFHTFNKRRSTQSRHRHYFSVFGQHNMRIKLQPHIVSNTNDTCQILAHT